MICETCLGDHDGSYASGRFCGASCARLWGRRSAAWKIPVDQFRTLALSCTNYAEFFQKLRIEKFDVGRGTTSYKAIKKRCQALGISHFEENFNKHRDEKLKPFDEIKSAIKMRVKRHNLIPYICASCKNTGIWFERPLVLQLHHKNGDSRDHRLVNLEFLCPNCHSQTDTFCVLNTKRARKRKSTSPSLDGKHSNNDT